jgi:hypothetical protein
VTIPQPSSTAARWSIRVGAPTSSRPTSRTSCTSTAAFCTATQAGRQLACSTADPHRRGAAGRGGEVRVEGERRGGDRRGEAGQQRDPAGEKPHQRVREATEVEVLAARLRQAAAEGGVAERAAQGDGAARDPGGEHRPRTAEDVEREARGGEGADADHVADDQRHRAGGPQAARRARHRRQRGAASARLKIRTLCTVRKS